MGFLTGLNVDKSKLGGSGLLGFIFTHFESYDPVQQEDSRCCLKVFLIDPPRLLLTTILASLVSLLLNK